MTRLTNEARVELRAKLKTAIAAAGEADAITPAMVNAAPKADLLLWAARFGVMPPAAANLALDAEVNHVLAHGGTPEDESEDNAEDASDAELDPIEALALADVSELQKLVAIMDGAAFKAKALDLARAAHKPAQTIEIEATPSTGGTATPRAHKARRDTLKNLFGVSGALGKITVDVWAGGSNVPARDKHYIWPKDIGLIVAKLLTPNADRTTNNVMLVGPAGTGKTSCMEQIASVLGRPFFRISFHSQVEASEIMGQRIITADNGMVWADGLLPMAMQVPGALILCDELDRARAGMLQSLQSTFDRRMVTFPETGHSVRCAEGVAFACAANTNGTGDASGQYTAAQQLDRATLDRMSDTVMVQYLPADQEARLLVAKTGCNAELAALLVHFAGVTRLDVAKGELPHGVGYRRLSSLSQSLVMGVDPESAIASAILNTVGPDEHEKLALLIKTHLSATVIRRALKGESVIAAALPGNAGRGAQDFTPVTE